MTRRSLATLILINAVLLAGVGVSMFAPHSEAQFASGSQYLMIAGEVVGRAQQSGVYVIDLTRGAVLPLLYNTSDNSLDVFPVRNVREDTQEDIRNR